VSHYFFFVKGQVDNYFIFVDSPFRTAISGAVLKLQEEGRLHILKTRWWKEKRGGGTCRVIIFINLHTLPLILALPELFCISSNKTSKSTVTFIKKTQREF
jgi:hypothetical protein